MRRFCSMFSSIVMACCIMNSMRKVVRSIINTILKLCTDFAKQYVRNTQKWGKTTHDNAPPHTSIFVHEVLAKKPTAIMPQPPNLPDLATAEFFFLQKLKTPMEVKHFGTIKDIKEQSIPKSKSEKCFGNWKKLWHKCIV